MAKMAEHRILSIGASAGAMAPPGIGILRVLLFITLFSVKGESLLLNYCGVSCAEGFS